MTESTNTNPATRLKTLISQLDQVAPKNNQADTFRNRFASVWGSAQDDFLIDRIRHCRRLIQQYEKVIQGCGQDVDLFLTIVPKLWKLFPLTSIDTAWDQGRAVLQGGDFTTLQFAERMLARQGLEWRIEQEELTSIDLMVDEVIFSVTNSSLKEETKELLLAHLQQVKQALKDYDIVGAVALQDALAQGIGQVIVHRDEINVPEAAESISKLQTLWAQMGKATEWAIKHQDTLLGAVDVAIKLLGGGGS